MTFNSTPSLSGKAVILTPVPEAPSWLDYVYMAAIPASAAINGGVPAVLAIEPNVPFQPELQDFLVRFKPERLFLMSPSAEKGNKDFASLFKGIETIPVKSPDDASNRFAQAFWKASEYVVMCPDNCYADGLTASALAARLRAPLLFCDGKGLSPESRKTVKQLGCRTLLSVGAKRPGLRGIQMVHLKNSHDIVTWMVGSGLPVNYLAAANPRDRSATRVKKLSLAAPMLAAGRDGAVALLDFKTEWKVPFKASRTYKKKLKSFPDSKAGWKKGTLALNGKQFTFVLTGDNEGAFHKVSFAEGNRRTFSGPYHTADRVKLGGRDYTVNLHPKDGVGQADLRLTWPGTPEVKKRLNRYYDTLGHRPEYLCLLGWPDAIPQAIVPKNFFETGSDIPTDLPFAQYGDGPFLDIAVGRFITENLWSATLLATRSLNYNELLDDSWSGKLGTACWETLFDRDFQNIGFSPKVHHGGKNVIGNSSPLRDVAAIAHTEHSSWRHIGQLFKWQDETIFSPTFVDTGGCSTMALDVQSEAYSAPARMLRNGAVCVSGNTRLGIGEQYHYRTEWWNAMLMGKSAGEAHRYALNRVLLAVLDYEQSETGGDRYQFFNRALFGDPAVTMHRPEEPRMAPATFTRAGDEITVYGPSKWWKYKQFIVPDWNYTKTPKLYAYHGFGIGVEKTWFSDDRYGKTKYYFVVELRTRDEIAGIEQVSKAPKPLGWNGKFWVQHHQDGSRSIFWRVRMIDVDLPNGKILKRVNSVTFRLIR